MRKLVVFLFLSTLYTANAETEMFDMEGINSPMESRRASTARGKLKSNKGKIRDRKRIHNHITGNGGPGNGGGVEHEGQPHSEKFEIEESTLLLGNIINEEESFGFSSSYENIVIGGVAVGVLGAIIKYARSLNPIGLALGVGSAGAYADFSSRYYDKPELIFSVEEYSELSWLLDDPSILQNTKKLLLNARDTVCFKENQIDEDLKTDFCITVSTLN